MRSMIAASMTEVRPILAALDVRVLMEVENENEEVSIQN